MALERKIEELELKVEAAEYAKNNLTNNYITVSRERDAAQSQIRVLVSVLITKLYASGLVTYFAELPRTDLTSGECKPCDLKKEIVNEIFSFMDFCWMEQWPHNCKVEHGEWFVKFMATVTTQMILCIENISEPDKLLAYTAHNGQLDMNYFETAFERASKGVQAVFQTPEHVGKQFSDWVIHKTTRRLTKKEETDVHTTGTSPSGRAERDDTWLTGINFGSVSTEAGDDIQPPSV